MAKALILTTDFGVEEAELVQPRQDLLDAGFEVDVASTGERTVQTVTGDKDWASTVEADLDASATDAESYDVLVVPGGTVNADNLRGNEQAQQILKTFVDSGKVVAAICHAPWILIDSGLAKGARVTSYTSVQPDLVNAGATWVDEQLVRHAGDGWVLLTSRNPGDLDAFSAAIVDEVGADS